MSEIGSSRAIGFAAPLVLLIAAGQSHSQTLPSGADAADPPEISVAAIEWPQGEWKAADPLLIQVRVSSLSKATVSVSLELQVMFEPPSERPMNDRGVAGDATAGDQVYSAQLRGGLAAPGQIVRWAVVATDDRGHVTRLPAGADPEQSRNAGVMLVDPRVASDLPVFYLFVEDTEAAETRKGTRGALFFAGELYDNVQIDLHGQSSAGFPKKSYDVEFPPDHWLRLRPEFARVKDINLLTNYGDKTKIRNTLAYEMYRRAGAAYHLALPVRVQMNGVFHAVLDLVEEGDERWLKRIGLDPRGALYKLENGLEDTSMAEKRARREEDDFDLELLIAGLELGAEARTRFIYDNIDLPGMVNFLAVLAIIDDVDCCHKNYYLYRDTRGNREWCFLPWDLDLSFGHRYSSGDKYYLDDELVADNQILLFNYDNRLLEELYALADFREMVFRRTRTLMDQLLQPPGTPASEGVMETAIDAIRSSIGADGDLDHTSWPSWGEVQTMWEATDRLVNDYLPRRRQYLFGTQVRPDRSGLQVLVSAEPGVTPISWHVPVDDSLESSWIQPEFDDSEWSVGAWGLGNETQPKHYRELIRTVVRPSIERRGATSVLVRVPFDVADPEEHRSLHVLVRYDDAFVAYLNGNEIARRGMIHPYRWNSRAKLREDLLAVTEEAIDVSHALEWLREGRNLLAIRLVNERFSSSDLLLTAALVSGDVPASVGGIPLAQVAADLIFDGMEVAADPAAAGTDYLRLRNRGAQAVDLSGWRVTGVVEHRFKPGTVLPGGGVLYLSPDVNAFRAREDRPSGGQALFVQGNYRGRLSEKPGAVKLVDVSGRIVCR